MNIAIGADHRGFLLKEYIKKTASSAAMNIEWIDVGCFTTQRTDYPLLARAVAHTIQQKQATLGVLTCGTGIGMSIAVNRFHGIYGALVWNSTLARLSREDDHANVLILPAESVTDASAGDILKIWLQSVPKPGRYKERLDMIDSFGGTLIETV